MRNATRVLLCTLILHIRADVANAQHGLPPGTRVDTVARGLEHPWGVAFSPDGRIFVSERPGRIRVIANGALQAGSWLELPVARGGAGLLGLALAPTFPADPRVFVMGAFAGPRDSTYVNRLLVIRESGGAGGTAEILLDELPSQRAHAGSAVAFGPDGMLYVTLGDAFEPALSQDPARLNGKILRLTAEGRPAPTNPDPRSPVYASGLRNAQGLAWNSADDLFATEHGPSNWPWEDARTGHDEINTVVANGNYGWPEVIGASGGRFQQPLLVWDPAVAPSGLVFYEGPYRPWSNSLLVGLLRGREIRRIAVQRREGSWHVASEESLSPFEPGTRVRGVFTGPDGELYVTSDRRQDADGRPDDLLLRIVLPRISSRPVP